MAIVLTAAVIDVLLLGVGGRRRELQDFPVLGDVWLRFAEQPVETRDGAEVPKGHDLLISPTWEKPTGEVAKLVAYTPLVKKGESLEDGQYSHRSVAYLHDIVVATLTLDELTTVALPATQWWDGIMDAWKQELHDDVVEEGEGYPTNEDLRRWIGLELSAAMRDEKTVGRLTGGRADARYDRLETEDRQTAKLGLLLGVLRAAAEAAPAEPPATLCAARKLLGRGRIVNAGAAAIRVIINNHREIESASENQGAKEPWNGLIFQVSLNRDSAPALTRSVAAIKGDAARSLFSISCKSVGWAVLDSGIDQTHRAFWDYEKIWKILDQCERTKEPPPWRKVPPEPRPHRIRAIYDFRRIRAIMSVNQTDRDALIKEIVERTGETGEFVEERLKELEADRKEGKRVNWARVQRLIRQSQPETPPHPHGTHVAGIIGAHWLDFKRGEEPQKTDPVKMDGVCPDIALYDFRVLGSSMGDSEFAVIAALQFMRFLNDQSGYSMIHGANLSLSIPHNVRNYACGRTPVCIEAEAAAANGIVVIAAAGNRGFQQYRLADNSLFESYAASSITDPGNAEGVITVGATHRAWPHTYGVSFFSSRGPTGDGRLKPDLLAPGEKITSCVPGQDGGASDQMDGTSMAAPHVSGAAALLMARHEELKGQPARVKAILCETATDLNRERTFQGHGMVDVLRAIQSI
ncbi:MAG: serine protease AprX [Sphingomonadales bacterium]|nr:serine protease AprX [Sphingomonadales bacterium]